MISISKILLENRVLFCLLGVVGLFLSAHSAAAQMSQSLSVSPTIFEMTAEPDRIWSSNVRVINPNPFDLQLYVEVVNFLPEGEVGRGKFSPIKSEETLGQTLAEWIKFQEREITVPAEQTAELRFSINVPEGAQPGGHFAAILVGTKPPQTTGKPSLIETSQVVTSLVFLRVTGDIHESGQIRSFRTTDWLLEEPEATFELRFENTGNVHVQPQGEIKIFNMWGQERGVIPVNRESLYGTVLPNSIRMFTFRWTGEWSIADIGRYTAVATLAYGLDQRQFTSSEIGFWVVPWKPALFVLVIVVGFVLLMTWSIKLYIRRMLSIAGVDPRNVSGRRPITIDGRRVSVVAPVEAGILDLRRRMDESESWVERFLHIRDFVRQYKLFFISAASIVLFVGSSIWYVQNASVSERGYAVTIERGAQEVSITSEDLEYEARKEGSNSAVVASSSLPKISIVNRSGVPGLAAELRLELESKGYEVVDLTTDLEVNENNTVIVYAPEFVEEALVLSREIDEALLSAFVGASEDSAPITIYVGQDYKNEVQ